MPRERPLKSGYSKRNGTYERKSLLKKAAAFFAKEIDWRIIDLRNNIIMNSACVGFCGALKSIVHPKKPDYEYSKPHKVFENKIQQNFSTDEINQKWCIDFTYLFLENHDVYDHRSA